MYKIYFSLLMLVASVVVSAQIINIPDPNFKAKLVSQSSSVSKNYIGQYAIIDTNNDGEIQTSEAFMVSELYVTDANIQSLEGINAFTNLVAVDCSYNQLTTISGTSMPLLQRLYCTNNQLQSLQLAGLFYLDDVDCGDNVLTNLDISNSVNLTKLDCRMNALTNLNLTGITKLERVYGQNNNLTTINLDGLTHLVVAQFDDNQLTSISYSNTPALRVLQCKHNALTNLDFSSNSGITTLDCGFNPLTYFDISGLTQLNTLNCNNTNRTSLDLTPLSHLLWLDCSGNQLTSLDFQHTPLLNQLFCSDNLITSLNLAQIPGLFNFNAGKNRFTTIDASANNITFFRCPDNPLLASVFLKNGFPEVEIVIDNNPNLAYICVDDSEIATVEAVISNSNLDNCSVSTYCSFEPGGISYRLNGTVKYDGNTNGCDDSDYNYSHAKFSVSVGNIPTTTIANTSGTFSMPVGEGSYTITPMLENPDYFSISPTEVNVSFPATASPFNQHFCVTALGNHQDVEIVLLPMEQPRPGFNSTYKIVYKNKGSQSVSGNIDLNFEGDILHLVSSSLPVGSQTSNTLTWDYQNLLPFETRVISVVLRLNSPTDIPAVVSGTLLLHATINPLASDSTPNDNHSELQQEIVNSFDPNDKICIEGNTITPEMVGKDVHYMIRFENTGTANAENIVVKDMIDTTKFDINSLIPIDGSHPFVTKILNNKVEFIFENISLPFDDANNDGYVAFKIKTKPTLVLGDTFSNTASIYFDYNFPIITNTATTAVALLANQDFEFADYFKIHPNPAAAILNIEMKQSIEITSINIYNTLGQLVLVIPNAQQTKSVDVSGLKTGNYLMKIHSNQGSSSVKFVKM